MSRVPIVHVHNRSQPEALEPDPNKALISIFTPGDNPARIREGWRAILFVEFSDFVDLPDDTPDLLSSAYTLFHTGQADDIRDFVRRHPVDLVVHCDAGVSRSVAVGRWLHECRGYELRLHATHGIGLANGRVFRLLAAPDIAARLTAALNADEVLNAEQVEAKEEEEEGTVAS